MPELIEFLTNLSPQDLERLDTLLSNWDEDEDLKKTLETSADLIRATIEKHTRP